MPADKEARSLASPWKEFLTELDGMLDEPLELHCIGGFVFTYFYGLPRTTGDIDYYTSISVNLNLDEVAGHCILSKLERNATKDRDDADYLFRSQRLSAQVLRDRYENELRHNLIGNVEWHDKTLDLWIEIFESQA